MTVGYDAEHSDLLADYMNQSLYGSHSFLAVKLIIIFELEIKDLFANKSLTLREYTYARSLNKGFTMFLWAYCVMANSSLFVDFVKERQALMRDKVYGINPWAGISNLSLCHEDSSFILNLQCFSGR